MAAGDVISFGPYRLVPAERLLSRNSEIIDVGSRALDVLIALVEAAGEVVEQRELMARAWPKLVVTNGSLRVAIAKLRRALNDGENEDRYITNVTGRGYCFVAPVRRTAAHSPESFSLLDEAISSPKPALPARLVRMVGREDAVETLSTLLASQRFVSVVGPGGLGKTTVAVAVAHALTEDFRGAVYFVDLSAVSDAQLVPCAVAEAMGVFVHAQDVLSSLLAFLAGRRFLLVLDSCEHVIEAAARLSERLYNDAPQAHILTTSREALRAEGEYVHLLAPLGYPVLTDALTAAEALTSPAVQLFIARATASGYTASLTDADARVVAMICGRLDGVALAIELAGSRVGAYGIQGTADLLNNRFKLLWQGRRTAPPRHQTLHAMLDWSFNLLSDTDRRVLIRLSIFVGAFTLEAAQAVAADDHTSEMEIAEAIDSLIGKSLVAVVSIDEVANLRLLDSTLAFAAEKLAQTGESNAIARQHARHYADCLSSRADKGLSIAIGDVTFAAPYLGNIRAALEWTFSDEGETTIGVKLAVAAAPLFYDLSLFVECLRWCERSLVALPESDEQSATRLTLQAFLAASAMLTRGNSDEVQRALEDALKLAEARGDQEHQAHLLAGLSIFLTRIGAFPGALAFAQRTATTTCAIGLPGMIAAGESILGVAYHYIGEQIEARRQLERALMRAEVANVSPIAFFGYDHELRARIALARCYWLMGFPDRAARTARSAIDIATKRDHPVNLCMTLLFATTVFLWRGDIDDAEELVRRLVAHAARHSLGPYQAVAIALTGELTIGRGNPCEGIALIRSAIDMLETEKHHALTPAFHVALAEGLMQAGKIDEAAEVVETGLARIDISGETLNLPELLRMRGEVALHAGPGDAIAAERAFQQSIQHAKEKAVLGLELRSATRLARLWIDQGKVDEAVELLNSIHSRFDEGFETTDLKLAAHLLTKVPRAPHPRTEVTAIASAS